MRRVLASVCIAIAALGIAGPASATRNPSGTGPPSQSCQALEPHTPGHASGSPGSPFDEPGINSPNGGTGGQHYSEKSQYDVACYQQATHNH
ncbi:hypothetical protein GCM10023094_24120 [Rhodococcus olei]|uniref:Adenylate cyclase n=1 Tax=Rhodococcus olei TaxID=2161675 RepID=A0ABP8P3P4_9NOCA